MLRRVTRDDLLFSLIYLFGMVDSIALSLSTVGDLPHMDVIRMGLRLGALCLLAIKCVIDRKYGLRPLIFMAAAGIILLLSFVRSKYNHIFYLLLVVVGMRRVDVRRMVRFDFVARVLMIIVIVTLSLTGVIENFVTYRTGSTDLRYSLGFLHPNTLASLVMTLVVSDAWLNRRRFEPLYAGAVLMIALATYAVTLSRTSLLMMLLFPLLLIPVTRIEYKNPISRLTAFAARWMLPAAALMAFVMMLNVDRSAIVKSVDLLLSKRFANAQRVYNWHGLSLLGQYVKLVSVKTAREENVMIAMLVVAYLRCMIQAGLLTLGVMTAMYRRMAQYACARNDRYTLMIMVLFVVYGFMESGFNNVYMNFSMLIAAGGMYCVRGDARTRGRENRKASAPDQVKGKENAAEQGADEARKSMI